MKTLRRRVGWPQADGVFRARPWWRGESFLLAHFNSRVFLEGAKELVGLRFGNWVYLGAEGNASPPGVFEGR